MKKNIIHFKNIRINISSDFYFFKNNGKINEKIKENFYLCNWAIKPNKKKMTRNIKKVTCKNCLRKIKEW
jgi:hypothetical protein